MLTAIRPQPLINPIYKTATARDPHFFLIGTALRCGLVEAALNAHAALLPPSFFFVFNSPLLSLSFTACCIFFASIVLNGRVCEQACVSERAAARVRRGAPSLHEDRLSGGQ